MNLWKCYLRWRHSKGFGVHSPFAYRFITDVLNPGQYGYYAYKKLDLITDLAGVSRRNIRIRRFLIRLLVFLSAERMICYGNHIEEALDAAKALKLDYRQADDSEGFLFHEKDFLYLDGGGLSESFIKRGLDSGVAIFAINPDDVVKRILKRPLERGLLFEGGDKMLLIPSDRMEYVAYDILFPGI